jgi:hypothetical protein
MPESQIVVDNSAGGDSVLAAEVARLLRKRGPDVELRSPTGPASFDTSVHLLSTGIVIRVPANPDRALLRSVATDVRSALMGRPSLRRRSRSVPVHVGESHRVLQWIDAVE